MEIEPLPLTPERFGPFGDVIAASPAARRPMNEARFDVFAGLARIDISGGRLNVSVARSRTPTVLPYRFDTIERHPLGSQAFVPLAPFRFVVVVAAPAEDVEASDLHAFVTNGHQGINYLKGTWHMPLIALEAGQEFLVMDRLSDGDNCEERVLGESVTLRAL
ncbi:MAG TPA: ureidoglycolate lyase [Woeseiaceae bacterium]|jgi:ureidoglycolate lyase|nr:ureidoglycolate lyase [Woeseiaceae bacterium]